MEEAIKVPSCIPIPEWKDLEQLEGLFCSDGQDDNSSEDNIIIEQVDNEEEEEEGLEDLSNGSFAMRHVFAELEERNRRFQYLKSMEKAEQGASVPFIDVKGILSDMSHKKTVTRHELYKDFLGMVQDHYSIRDDCLETEDMLVKVRSMITDNAVTLKDLFATPDDTLQGECVEPSITVGDQWTVDATKSGRCHYDNFVPPDEETTPTEENPDDEEYEEDPLDDEDEYMEDEELYGVRRPNRPSAGGLSPKQLREFLADTESADESGDSSPDGKRKRGRPKKNDMKPKIIVLTEVKEKRGRGRPRRKHVVLPGTLEVIPDPVIDDLDTPKRKRGRPKKIRLAEFTITTETLGKVVEQLQVLQSPTHSNSSGPSTPTTPIIEQQLSPSPSPSPSPSQHKDLSQQPKRKRGRPKKCRPELTENLLLTDSVNDLESSSIYLSPENSVNFCASNDNDSADDDSQNPSFGAEFNEAKLSKSESDNPSSQTETQSSPPEKRKRGRPRKTRVEQPFVNYEMKKPKYQFVEASLSPLDADDDGSAARRTRSTRKVLSYMEPEDNEDHDHQEADEENKDSSSLRFTPFFTSDDKSTAKSTRKENDDKLSYYTPQSLQRDSDEEYQEPNFAV